MFNHAPHKYECPVCQLIIGEENKLNKHNDIVYQNNEVFAYISPKWWINNPGHVMVVPKKHFENLYDIPDDLLGNVNAIAKKSAIALKEVYKCDGTSTRQHNEPAGNQDLWHFHIHVFPRYLNDKLYQNHDKSRIVSPEERNEFARKLKKYFDKKF